jgi:hypothetical protein
VTDPFLVDPARLASGRWDDAKNRDDGAGDIHRSYSADRIGAGRPIRRPFEWHGNLWVCVSIIGSGLTPTGTQEFHAYKLVPSEVFKGEPTSYGKKCSVDAGDLARSDPNGFYHGMAVKHDGETFVLMGPPAVFLAEPQPERPVASFQRPEQLGLFE